MHAPELDELLPALRDTDADVRANAAGALGALGADGVPAIAPLFAACRDVNHHVRGEAAHSLWEIAGSLYDQESAGWPSLTAGLPTLISLLDDPSWDVRCCAMSVLQRLGPAAEPALPRLRQLLTGEMPGLDAALGEWRSEFGAGLV